MIPLVPPMSPEQRSRLHEIEHQFQDLEGWLSPEVMLQFELSLLEIAKDNHLRCLPLLEIGSYRGRFTCFLASVCKEQQFPSKVIAIDPMTGSSEHNFSSIHQNENYLKFQRNIKNRGLSSWIQHFKMTSNAYFELAWAAKPPGEDGDLAGAPNLFSFCFVDGSHVEVDVKQDALNALKCLATGGYLFFHDYKWPGVKKTIWELAEAELPVSSMTRVEDTVFFQKLSAPCPLERSKNLHYIAGERELQSRKRQSRQLRRTLNAKHPLSPCP